MTRDPKQNIQRAIEGHALSEEQMFDTMNWILSGNASEVMISALAVALRVRGITPRELAAAARAMRSACRRMDFEVDGPLVDTCGTGGDGSGSFNISTVSAIVIAACGAKVAKHGNRAVSSKCGSADLLEALDVRLDVRDDTLQRCISEHGIAFLFAPGHHGALKHAAPVRKELGVRTFFNMLGPLCNPAGATHQLVGVYDASLCTVFAEVLGSIGVEGAWVVHGAGGLDEVSPYGPTKVATWDGANVEEHTVSPSDFGLEPLPEGAIAGGDAAENAAITRTLFEGTASPYRTAVVLNAAAALCAAGLSDDPKDAANRCAEAIDSGRARDLLQAWADCTSS